MPNIKNFKPRLYQETILSSCTEKNTLVALPTGLGKTKTAILVAIDRLNKYSNSKILFLTPTKPLATQIYNEFRDCTDIKEIELFTGAISPEKRKELAKSAKIIISTPQSIENDVINNTFKFDDVSLIVFDEAHRAIQNYSYTWLAKKYNSSSTNSRIIGLTASPGADLEKIKEVCNNLYIKNIEVRTENDPDVKEYVQKTEVEWIKINLPEEFKEIRNFLQNAFSSKLKKLKEGGYSLNANVSKKELLGIMASLRGEISKGTNDYNIFSAISSTAEAIKINHALDLIETQGIHSLYSYLKPIIGNKGQTKSGKNLALDINMKSAFILSEKLYEQKINHPKLSRLKEIIKEEIEKNPKTKIIVFNQYRDSAKRIENELIELENVRPKLFVGQLKKKGTGLSQKEQINIINEFKEGIHNCIISTSIGEEGLDIPKVNTVIFYEPVPSAIRSIQRRGRTARHTKGKVIVLMTKNTRDEAYHWTAVNKEKKMYSILNELKHGFKLNPQKQLNAFEKKEELNIYADSREQGSTILKELVDLGINITTKTLPTADFIVSSRVGIERKTIRDFVDSIIDKRLFDQLKNLKANFEKPLIILEGEEDIYSIRNIHANSIRGMLATITISYGIPLIQTKNTKETAQLLRSIAKREQIQKEKTFNLNLEKKPLTTRELQEYIISSLPTIGPTLAKALLREFKTVKNIINAKSNQLEKIEKLGKKKTKIIKEIINEQYDS
ncbi:DEAD/DEAH box helicase [archaeon]|jgi:ERCC4-related helicase|nr:DEAD/DEAH box helicase [archaeon]